MRIRVVRFQSRNPVVAALVVALVLALLVALLTVGVAVGGALAAVGGAAVLVRRGLRARGLARGHARRDPPRLDTAREVFPPTPDGPARRLPPGAG